MKILVTGAKGFIGKNLILALRENGYKDIFEYDIDTLEAKLSEFCNSCDFVFHLAGVNRPQSDNEFKTGNTGFTEHLLGLLRKNLNNPSVMYASSTQAELDNPYGRSKKEAEDLVFAYAAETGAKTLVYRFPNVFGKWCRPNYNSAVATFCYNTANDLPIQVNDRSVILTLAYIDDVIQELLCALKGNENSVDDYCYVPVTYSQSLGVIANTIQSFDLYPKNLTVPDSSDMLTKKLYCTYLSYLPVSKFKYPLDMHCDERGAFTEFIRTPNRGQVSINVSKPGVTKGNHRHDSKHEKFLVVGGSGVVRFRLPGETEIIEIPVSGDKLEVVEIPPGYTHSIVNTSETEDMIMVVWVNEAYDPNNPDTYKMEV